MLVNTTSVPYRDVSVAVEVRGGPPEVFHPREGADQAQVFPCCRRCRVVVILEKFKSPPDYVFDP